MYVIVVKPTQKMIGPFKTITDAEQYLVTKLNFISDIGLAIVKLSEP